MRLKVGKAGQFLNLRRGTGIQLDINSPVWFGDRSGDFIPGYKSYSFTVPNDSHNRLILQRPDLLDNPEDFLSEDGWQILFDGWLVFEGRIEVEDTKKEEEFRITFIGGLAGNFQLLKDTYLPDLPLPEIELGEEETDILSFANDVASNPEDYNFLFPTIKVDEFGAEKYEYINYYISNQYIRNQSVLGQDLRSSLVPMLRLKYVLESAFALAGYALSGVMNTGTDADELQSLIIFNNRTIDTLTQIPGGEEIAFEALEMLSNISLANYLPTIKCNELIRDVCNTFLWAPFIDFSSRQVELKAMRDILRNASFIDYTKKCNPQFVRAKKLEDLPESFVYEHTGDDAYAEKYAPSYRPRKMAKVFKDVDDLQTNITNDDRNTIVYIESVNEYFDFLGLRPPNDTPILMRMGQDFGIINERVEPVFTIGADSLLMYTSAKQLTGQQSWLFAGGQFLPAFYGDVVSPWYEDSEQLNDLILLFYRGIQQDAEKSYPLASSTNYNHAEEKIGDLSLLLTGESGLYNVWWKDWHEALFRMRPVTYQTRLTASDLALLDFSQKVRIDKHLYFIKRVQVTLTTDEIKPAIVEYMQIN